VATLTRLWQWQKFVPDLGDNKEQPSPFYLEVAAGLTVGERQALAATLAGALAPLSETEDYEAGVALFAKQAAEALAPFVRLGKEPLEAGGKPIDSLEAYLGLVARLPGLLHWGELTEAVRTANSLEGLQALFSERRSGGSGGTRGPSVVKGESETAAP